MIFVLEFSPALSIGVLYYVIIFVKKKMSRRNYFGLKIQFYFMEHDSTLCNRICQAKKHI